MADANGISGALASLGAPRGSNNGTPREARIRAQVGQSDSQSPQNSRAAKRLEAALKSEKPLRRDVPRGYYLDIKV